MPIALGVSILVSGAFGVVQVTPVQEPVHHAVTVQMHTNEKTTLAAAVMSAAPDPDVESAVEDYFSDVPVMVAIARCESKFHQYDLGGNILMSVTDDIGVMQINADAHSDEALQMGYDLSTVHGNMAFARYLYNNLGTAPWNSSARCWAPRTTQKNSAAKLSLASQTGANSD